MCTDNNKKDCFTRLGDYNIVSSRWNRRTSPNIINGEREYSISHVKGVESHTHAKGGDGWETIQFSVSLTHSTMCVYIPIFPILQYHEEEDVFYVVIRYYNVRRRKEKTGHVYEYRSWCVRGRKETLKTLCWLASGPFVISSWLYGRCTIHLVTRKQRCTERADPSS